MHALRAARPLARAAAGLACVLGVVSGLVVAGCAASKPAAARALVGLVPTHPRPQVTGPTAAQISRFRWSDLPPPPLGPRSQPLLAWAGGELLELGGLKKGTTAYDGDAFNPAAGRWYRLAHVAPATSGSGTRSASGPGASYWSPTVSSRRVPRSGEAVQRRRTAGRTPGCMTQSLIAGPRPGCPSRWTGSTWPQRYP